MRLRRNLCEDLFERVGNEFHFFGTFTFRVTDERCLAFSSSFTELWVVISVLCFFVLFLSQVDVEGWKEERRITPRVFSKRNSA